MLMVKVLNNSIAMLPLWHPATCSSDLTNSLAEVQQAELTRFFLADGISNQAIVCEFLPLCLERAKANPFVTIGTFLEAQWLLRALLVGALNRTKEAEVVYLCLFLCIYGIGYTIFIDINCMFILRASILEQLMNLQWGPRCCLI